MFFHTGIVYLPDLVMDKFYLMDKLLLICGKLLGIGFNLEMRLLCSYDML